MNLVLIGMRGAGKTTIAKILAEKLQKEYVEMDEVITKKANTTIPEMVEKYGWEYFRNRESEVVKELAIKDNCVISTGGGVVLKPENIAAFKKNGKIFWLQVNVPTLLRRIGNDNNRPSLTGNTSREEDMKQTLEERYGLYEQAADGIVNTEHMQPLVVAKKIIQML